MATDKFVYVPTQKSNKVEDLKISTLLPTYIQTPVNKNFFDATFETLFSVDKVETVSGYIGEKPDRIYNPKTDFYIPESTKERQDYQFSPVVTIKDKDDNILNEYFYSDMVNHVRYHGGNVDSQERMFFQEYYSYSPLIDINKFINYNQYYWLDKGPAPIDFVYKTDVVNYNTHAILYADKYIKTGDNLTLAGNLPTQLHENVTYYAILVGDQLSFAKTKADALVGKEIAFTSIHRAEFIVNLPTDIMTVVGKSQDSIMGIHLLNGMVIRTYNDRLAENNAVRWIVEGVGTSIRLLKLEEYLGYDSSPYDTTPYDDDDQNYALDPSNIDYVTIHRLSKDGNAWSMRNRWFHISVLSAGEINNEIQARRPIIEFIPDIQLYNLGTNYRGLVNCVFDKGNIQSITGLSSVKVDGFEVIDGSRILVINDTEVDRTNKIYEVFGLRDGSLSLNEIATVVDGDNVNVFSGEKYGNKALYLSGKDWKIGQTRTSSNQDILFQLYDYEGNSLSDDLIYPESNFKGSPVFGYKINDAAPLDPVLLRHVERNEYDNVMFRNFISTTTYQYKVDFIDTDIRGYYFMKVGDEFKNHWHKSDRMLNQGIIDEFEIYAKHLDNGAIEYQEIYTLSQTPAPKGKTGVSNIQVKLNGIVLAADTDYQMVDGNGFASLNNTQHIRLSLNIVNSLKDGDLLKVVTYSHEVPPQPIKGYYEVPTLVGLVGNSSNDEIIDFGRNEIMEHFVSIIERQNGFSGDALGYTTSPAATYNYGRGIKVIQNTASLLKVMALSAENDTGVIPSLEYSAREYNRFANQLASKFVEFYNIGYTEDTTYNKWINDAVAEINLGKSSDFPYEFSGVARLSFIPPSPAYLGMSGLYLPQLFEDTTLVNKRFMIRCHDGRLIPARTEILDDSKTQNIVAGSNQYVLNESVVFPWEIIVRSGSYVYTPYSDYTVYGGNTIVFNKNINSPATIDFIPQVLDRVTLFYEYEVYNSAYNTNNSYNEFKYQNNTPGYFRESGYGVDAYNSIMEPIFNQWVSRKGFNYIENTTTTDDPLTWNYTGVQISNGTILKGSWRNVFRHFYDTDRPDTAPWEMLGFYAKPSWWVEEYGYGPYTAQNSLMWDDIRDGVIRQGPREGKYAYLARPTIYDFLPVDDAGNIKTIMTIFNVAEPNIMSRKADWNFGDIGPAEFEWMRSGEYPFAVSMAQYLMRPNAFVDLLWEPSKTMRVFPLQEDSQVISSDTLMRVRNKDLKIFGTLDEGQRVFRFGLQQYIVAHLIFKGKSPEYLRDIVHNCSVQMGYRVGGFVEKNTLRFVADNFGLVPHENIHVTMHKSSSIEEKSYSGIILSRAPNGYRVSGYDTRSRKFNIMLPETKSASGLFNVGGKPPVITDWIPNVRYNTGIYVRVQQNIFRCVVDHRSAASFGNDSSKWAAISETPLVGGISVRSYDNLIYPSAIRYDEVLDEAQDIYNLFMGYQKFLLDEGFVFSQVDSSGVTMDFEWAVRQVFAWMLTSPKEGESVTLSPFGEQVEVNIEHGFVNSLTEPVAGLWPIVNENGQSIEPVLLEVSRSENKLVVDVKTDSTKERMSTVNMSLIEIEHVVIFDNNTNFHDIIYNDLYGIRQQRLKAYISKSSGWTGKMEASGFVITNDTIVSNIEKNTSDFTRFYDSTQTVIGGDFNSAAKKLIGFQDRKYFENLLFDQREAFQFYQGFLREKGTISGLEKFMRNDFVQSIENIRVNEEWAIKLGDYGATDAYSAVDIRLVPEDMRSNPQMVKFIPSGEDDPRNSIIEISPDDSRYVYKRPINTSASQFKTDYMEAKLPAAGYLVLSDAEYKVPFANSMTSYYFENYGKVKTSDGEKLWMAESGNSTWGWYRIIDSTKSVTAIEKTETGFKGEFDETINVGDFIILIAGEVSTMFEITSSDGTEIEFKANGSMEGFKLEDSAKVKFVESIRFVDQVEFDAYVPRVSWTNKDVVALDNEGMWEIVNPDTGAIIRKREKQISLSTFVSSRLYDTEKALNIFDLEVYHPFLNVLPTKIKQNLDYISEVDPADYSNNAGINTDHWTYNMTGKMWWDISSVRFLDYDQTNDLYKMNHWGSIFPGTSVDVYQWVRSPFHPADWVEYITTQEGMDSYSETSRPRDVTQFIVNTEYDSSIAKYVDYYYFWIKGNYSNPAINSHRKTLSTVAVRDMIQNPTSSGIHWICPISETTFIVSNIDGYLNENTNIKLSFIENKKGVIHSEWYLFSATTDNRNPPMTILNKVRQSVVGYVQIIGSNSYLLNEGFTQSMIDEYGTVMDNGNIDLKLPVPDPKIISMSPYGSKYRPRQSWYKDINSARRAFVAAVNKQLSLFDWRDAMTDWQTYLYDADPEPAATTYDEKVATLFDRNNLVNIPNFNVGDKVLVETDITINGRWSLWEYEGNNNFKKLKQQGYRVSDYWKFVDYYREGYNKDTIVTKTYANLVERNVDLPNMAVGSLLKVMDDGSGRFVISEVVEVNGEKSLELVGKQNGTMFFEQLICTCPYASEALDVLFRGFYASLSNPLDRNAVLSEMIIEAFRQHYYVDWVFKTSFVDIVGMEDVLEESPITKPDLSSNVIDYFNELKPYHVKIRGTVDKKYATQIDDASFDWQDSHIIETTMVLDKVSCVPNMTLPIEKWTAAERIKAAGGNPSDVIPGCEFRGTEIDGKFFNIFKSIMGAGNDIEGYYPTELEYHVNVEDVQFLYDVVINGKDFSWVPSDVSDTVIDGGAFYQPLMSANRPPELAFFNMSDTLSLDVYTFSRNVYIDFGYDVQSYDAEITENNTMAGYDYASDNPYKFVLRPKMIADLYLGDGINDTFRITQIPQSNDAVFVYLDEMLVNDAYDVIWNGLKPSVKFYAPPADMQKVKIVSYSVGGSSNTVVEHYERNITSNTIDVGTNLYTYMNIQTLVNGVLVDSSISPDSIRAVHIPSAHVGDTVYIVAYEGDNAANIYTTRHVYNGSPLDIEHASAPDGIRDLNDIVYMDGLRLNPAYSKYYDTIAPIDNVVVNELIRDKDYMEVFVRGNLLAPTDYEIGVTGRQIKFATQIEKDVEVHVRNHTFSAFHYVGKDLYIHTIARSKNQVSYVDSGSTLNINGAQIIFANPNGGRLPVDIDQGQIIIESDDIDFSGTTGMSGSMQINGVDIHLEIDDTYLDILNKIETEYGITNVRATRKGSKIVLVSDGFDIILDGPWGILGIIPGEYKSVVSIIHAAMANDYPVLTLDGHLIIQNNQGLDLNFANSGPDDVMSLFGFDAKYSNVGRNITVVSMVKNDTANMRTEVYEGNVLGEYPIARSIQSEFSSNISVIGFDKTVIDGYKVETIQFGYDLYGYDDTLYDYKEHLGITFNVPQYEIETVIVTTYSGVTKEVTRGTKVFKNLRNEFTYYELADEYNTFINADFATLDDVIYVDDVAVLPIPNVEKNIPAYVWVEGEIIGYFKVDPATNTISNLIRGAMGTPFCYWNKDVNGVKYIKEGTVVKNLSDHKITTKDFNRVRI